jgi:hypothetical protein
MCVFRINGVISSQVGPRVSWGGGDGASTVQDVAVALQHWTGVASVQQRPSLQIKAFYI